MQSGGLLSAQRRSLLPHTHAHSTLPGSHWQRSLRLHTAPAHHHCIRHAPCVLTSSTPGPSEQLGTEGGLSALSSPQDDAISSRRASSLFCSSSGRGVSSVVSSHGTRRTGRGPISRQARKARGLDSHETSPSSAEGQQGPGHEPEEDDLAWLSGPGASNDSHNGVPNSDAPSHQSSSTQTQGAHAHSGSMSGPSHRSGNPSQAQESNGAVPSLGGSQGDSSNSNGAGRPHSASSSSPPSSASLPSSAAGGNGAAPTHAGSGGSTPPSSQPHSSPHQAPPHQATAATTAAAAEAAGGQPAAARLWAAVAERLQAVWERVLQLDFTQISVPVDPTAGRQARQVLSMLASLPLIRSLVKYRNIVTRVVVTIAMLAVIRSGLYIALPGVDLAAIPTTMPVREGERLVRALYGQATALPASLFDLGISPYINASIAVVMVLAIPDPAIPFKSLTRLKEARKQGRSGQAFITSIINGLALLIAVYLALIKAYQLLPFALFSASFVPNTAVALVAGSAIIQHCANIITASGIGNGSSLVICMSIMDEYAGALHNMLSRFTAGVVDPSVLATLLLCYLGLALAAVYISRTELRLPTTQYASIGATQGRSGSTGDDDMDMDLFAAARQKAELRMASRNTRVDYFPLQINTSGMMSIILAGAFWFVLLPNAAEFCGLAGLQQGLLSIQSSFWGLAIYGLFVMALEFLPLGGVNPKEVAEYLSAVNVGVKGIIPGEQTEKHIQARLLQCKFWGGLVMGLLAVCAQLFDMACLQILGASLSATSLLIIVGTVMQSSRQVESLLEGPRLNEKLSREHDVIQGLRAI